MSPPPLNAEQQARFRNLCEDLEDLTAGADPSLPRPSLDQDLLTRLAAEGSSHATLPIRFLDRCGLRLKTSDQLADSELREQLWQLIWVLGLLRVFLRHTDHLDDRRLYDYLLQDGLLDPTAFMPGEDDPPFYYLDPTSGSDQPLARLRLAYYSQQLEDEDLRLTTARAGDEPVEPLRTAHDRDRFLP